MIHAHTRFILSVWKADGQRRTIHFKDEHEAEYVQNWCTAQGIKTDVRALAVPATSSAHDAIDGLAKMKHMLRGLNK